MRCGEMCSVLQTPRMSFLPYSTMLSSPALYTMQTVGLSKMNLSFPLPPLHGISLSLQDSMSPSSRVSAVYAVRYRSSLMLILRISRPKLLVSAILVPVESLLTMTWLNETYVNSNFPLYLILLIHAS